MSGYAKARAEQRIVAAFHDTLAANPDHAQDSAWIITAAAYTLGEDEATVRRIWRERFADHGVM